MSAMESPISFPESPMEEPDAVYPCKGCGDILEEGKAFELAGNRWHIECFRCNTCGTLLDSDAHLLLLGDGSLICNNCTYSCNACGNKIEDLAILTGDQAFCATCFRCRNCKKKIENLRYARTSHGIFCMRCHEIVMEKRRKKQKPSKSASSNAPAVLDKSLPALPPNANPPATYDIAEARVDENERQPRSNNSPTTLDAFHERSKREYSPLPDESREIRISQFYDQPRAHMFPENLTLPASTYRDSRYSTVSSAAQSDVEDDTRGFLPMAFDPNPPALPNALESHPTNLRGASDNEGVTPRAKEVTSSRDYFNPRSTPKSSHRDLLREGPSSRSGSAERESSKPSSPRVPLQERARSAIRRKEIGDASDSTGSTPGATQQKQASQGAPQSPYALASPDAFKLQDAPRTRKGSIRAEQPKLSKEDPDHPVARNITTPPPDLSAGRFRDAPSPDSGINPFDDPKLQDAGSRHPARGDSLAASARRANNSTTDRGGNTPVMSSHTRNESVISNSSLLDPVAYAPRSATKPLASPLAPAFDIPPRAATRPSAPSKSVANDDFMAPRTAPNAPLNGHSRRNESVSSFTSPDPVSPGRTHPNRPSLGPEFSMEEEMSRIIGRKPSIAAPEPSPSVLRRVSNAVRHGRSFSDRAVPLSKSPTSSHLEISSPLQLTDPVSPSRTDDVSALRAHLRRAQQRIAELESEKLGLQVKMDTSGDLRQVNTELRAKRSTVAFLDTQREMVVRELEVMTEHLVKAKDTGQPLDLQELKTDILQDFAHSMQRVKETLGSQIEDLIHRRNELTDEIANLIQVKDKGLQEFESLSSKNSQLNELNSQLVHNIQDVYKANRVPNGSSMNDLRGGTAPPIVEREHASIASFHHPPPEMGEAQVINGPQVVNIRKGQPKKFNWKKGGNVAKNVGRNIKGAFAKDGQYDINGNPIGPYPGQPGMLQSDNGSIKTVTTMDSEKSRLAFFSSQKNGLKPTGPGNLKSSSSTNLLGTDPSVLFGSDLSARCDYEKRIMPHIVTRCIEEVEARGMDVEGVYRKSGGSGQVKAIQAGFDKDGGFDIADPDIDIHAVTSCLKQYFRKLPNPLITFDVYESVLEAAQLPEIEKRGMAMKIALGNLPESHRDVLEFLVGHLERVVEKEKENLMTTLNIAVVFAPTIMRPTSIEREMTDMQAQRDAVMSLLDNRAMIFD